MSDWVRSKTPSDSDVNEGCVGSTISIISKGETAISREEELGLVKESHSNGSSRSRKYGTGTYVQGQE
jgi:hypothetical protein